MAYNINVELPEPTGRIEEDYNELYMWAINITDNLRRICNGVSTDITNLQNNTQNNIQNNA